jgi:hypothetical protein
MPLETGQRAGPTPSRRCARISLLVMVLRCRCRQVPERRRCCRAGRGSVASADRGERLISTRPARRPLQTAKRSNCLAEVVGLELRNVVAKYLFETSHRFAGMQPNSDLGDYSRLSCGAEEMQLGPSLVPGSREACRQARPTTRSRRRPGRRGRHRCRAGARCPRRPLSRSRPPRRLRGSAGRTWCRAGCLP